MREGTFSDYKEFGKKLPKEVTIFIQLMMDDNPRKRPSAEEIKADKHSELKRLRKKAGKSLTPVPLFVPIQ